jgi:hypothetical protein
MSSRFLCECGARVEKNLFSGHGVAFLVPEEAVDKDFSQISGEALVREIVMKSRHVVTCRGCSRLYVIDENGEGAIQCFRPEVDDPTES